MAWEIGKLTITINHLIMHDSFYRSNIIRERKSIIMSKTKLLGQSFVF